MGCVVIFEDIGEKIKNGAYNTNARFFILFHTFNPKLYFPQFSEEKPKKMYAAQRTTIDFQ